MKRLFGSLLIALPAILQSASNAHAQRINPARSYGGGVGVFVGSGYGGGYIGPGYGFFPSYYNGFYGNGFSAYGPPVPTFAPVPGVFGGADQRHYGLPSAYWGLHRFGYRSPSPRPLPNLDFVAPGNFADGPALVEEPRQLPLMIEVRCHDDATVTVDGGATRQRGPVRTFSTPGLSTAEVHRYEIRATWEENGKPITKIRAATGKGGERVVVDFTER